MVINPESAARSHRAARLDSLDGVRTIAVFLVILFHVSTPWFAAGYLGVDVFFVLSGYLITTGLLRSVEKRGSLNLGDFWVRRFKRLMPAALLMLATVTIWVFFFAPISRGPAIGGDLWWTLIYLANWHLMVANTYFAATGDQSPLLHMWSLAVEEQFYVAWPLVLLLVLLVARRMVAREARHARVAPRFAALAGWATGLLIVASALALALLFDPSAPDRAYMGTDTKAFEPLLGALLAILMRKDLVRDWISRHHMLVSGAGIVIMVALFPFLDGPAPFYYTWGALAFSIGSVLLIGGLASADGRGPIAMALGWGPVAYLGRISYGLYLWHWPLAIWIIEEREGFRWIRATAVVAATLVCAMLSYHLVEMPIRTKRWFTSRRTIVLAMASIAVMLPTVSFAGGTPMSPALLRLLPQSPVDRSVILLVGDSVPARFSGDLEAAANARGYRIALGTAGGCAPSGEPVPLTPGEPDTDCSSVVEKQEQAITQFNPGTVVWWSRYELADRRIDGAVVTPEDPRFWEETERSLHDTARRLMSGGAKLVMIDTDRIGMGVYSRCTPEDCHPFLERLAHEDQYRQRWNDMVHRFAERTPDVSVVAVDDLYCTDAANPCDDRHGGVPARDDGSHFSNPNEMPEIAKGVVKRVLSAVGLR